MTNVFFVLVFSLVFTSTFQCPQGWRQSTIDATKCYLIVVSKKIWFEAEAYCSSAAPNSFLTSITSAYETYSLNAIVTDTPSISTCDQLWIGANDFDQNGVFTWTDNKPFQYTNWNPGQPDLNNQCVSSQARTTGKWKTGPCGTENCFICETFTSSSATTIPSRTTTTPFSTTVSSSTMTDCYDWLHIGGATQSGIYYISPRGMASFQVYCDMTTDGGGWTMFQRRVDGSLVFFNKTWQQYKNGFNNGLENNFWLGNDKLHVLSTKDRTVALRTDIWGDRSPTSPFPNGRWFETYSSFSVDDEANYYAFHVSTTNFTGNATSSVNHGMFYLNGRNFTTVDVDNNNPEYNEFCRSLHLGGWWLKYCAAVALNGKYVPYNYGSIDGFNYWVNERNHVNPVGSQMMLRKTLH